jgi:hypothetical protein
MGYYDPLYSNFYDPYWGWSSSRWMYGNSFGYGYSPYGYGGFMILMVMDIHRWLMVAIMEVTTAAITTTTIAM